MSTAALSAPSQPHRLGVLFVATACNVGIWILVGLFATSEFYRRAIVLGGLAEWDQVLVIQMITALNWAMFTPLVVFLAERLPLRPPHLLRNGAAVIALIPLLGVLRAAMGGAVLNLAEHHRIDASFVNLSIALRTHRYIAILAVIFFISNLVDEQREAVERERQRVRAQTLLARTEIDELRMRLRPQFALRMLRHIGSVLHDQPKAADALIVTLSDILRRSMAREGDERIRLGDELEHFDRCLDLCRAGGRFSLPARYVANDDVLACRVPALVLQPLIETVVLDLTSGAGGSVDVHCMREENETRIEVSWTVATGGAAMKNTLRIPAEEARV